MEKFTVYTGTTVPLMNDNIDTDQILPKQFLKLIDKKGLRIETLSLIDQNIVKQLSSSQGITLGQGLRGSTLLGL